MCLTGTLLRNVLVLLLLANSCGKRTCNYKEILGSYREVILVELQNLNLTATLNTSKERDACPSAKVWHRHMCTFSTMDRARRILISIYGMTQQMRCQRNGKKQSNLERPLDMMETLIVHNCSPEYLGKKTTCSPVQKTQGKKRKRMRLIKVIKALITCWQKLLNVYGLSK